MLPLQGVQRPAQDAGEGLSGDVVASLPAQLMVGGVSCAESIHHLGYGEACPEQNIFHLSILEKREPGSGKLNLLDPLADGLADKAVAANRAAKKNYPIFLYPWDTSLHGGQAEHWWSLGTTQ